MSIMNLYDYILISAQCIVTQLVFTSSPRRYSYDIWGSVTQYPDYRTVHDQDI